MLTQQRLKELLAYDPETGVFTRISNSRRTDLCGKSAGCLNPNGYTDISVDGRKYKGHRLAWLYVYGKWPPQMLDHKNLNKSDNRIENLREASRAQNEQNKRPRSNSSSGVTGVYWNKCAKKWQAYIKVDRAYRYLGIYEDFDIAVAIRRNAEKTFFGAFAPGGPQ